MITLKGELIDMTKTDDNLFSDIESQTVPKINITILTYGNNFYKTTTSPQHETCPTCGQKLD